MNYWTPAGKQLVEDTGIEVIDRDDGNLLNMTPAWVGWGGSRKYWQSDIDEAHSKGLAITAYEGLFYTSWGDFIFKDGEIYTRPDYENIFGKSDGQPAEYPLKALYQSPYWGTYFPDKWRNPDGSVMVDPIEGGCARNVQNSVIGSPDWGMAYMSIHNPHYLDFIKKCLEIDVDIGFDGIQIDCVEATPFALWQGGDFSPWAEQKFKEYLAHTYTPEELSRMGVEEIREFSLRAYVLNRDYRNRVNVDDLVVRAWSNFEYEAYHRFLSAIYNHVKSYSQAKGRNDFSVTGNKCPVDSPFAIISNKYSDVTWFEYGGDLFSILPPMRLTLLVRQAWALSRSKPVWQNFIAGTEEIGQYISRDSANLLAMMYAQVYSLGGVYIVHRQYDTPGGEVPMGPKSSKMTGSYCKFVQENETYFVDAYPRKSRIGIAYSLPSKMLGYYPSLEFERSWDWDTGLLGLSHVLEREHIPHDFIVLGDSKYWDEYDISSALSDRDVLVLSNAEVMTEEQVRAIRSFVEKGGRLLSFGAIATRDEEYNLRETPALADLTKSGLNSVGEGKALHLSGNPGFEYWTNVIQDRKEDPSNYQLMRDAVGSLLERPAIIETNAPDTVFMSVLQQGNQNLQIHLVNLDYNVRDDSVREKDGIKIKTELPSGFLIEGKEGRLMTPDRGPFYDPYAERLEFSSADGYVEFEVPVLRIYSIATIYDPRHVG